MADYEELSTHMENYWDKALSSNYRPRKRTLGTLAMHIGYVKLPNPAVSPNDKYFAHTQFYWDTYFTLLGLVVRGRANEARLMVDNLCYLFEKFKLMPARNSWTSVGRSQPPYLTRMAFEVYDHNGADKEWLAGVMEIAKQEYEHVWMSGQRFDSNTGLSRYAPRFWKRRLTVYESGWDSSARYKPENYKFLVPVDLNCQLYQYEADFARFYELTHDEAAAKKWREAQKKRKQLINTFFWDEESGFYYDYNLKTKKIEPLKSLAGFYPLWCGVASPEQATRAVHQLHQLEHGGGLTNTEKVTWKRNQWDHPNGWAPQQYITFEGLRKYGFINEATHIAKKWLDLNLKVFERTGKVWEKYDVVQGHIGWRGKYPTQAGFAWTNAIFLRLKDELDKTSDRL